MKRGGEQVNGIGSEQGVRHMVARVKGKVYQVIGYKEYDAEKQVANKRMGGILYTAIKEIAMRRAKTMLENGEAAIVQIIPPNGPYISNTGKEVNLDKWLIL